MAEAVELDARIARLEAALDATSGALAAGREATARPDPEDEATNAALKEARDRIAALEAALAAARKSAEAAPAPAATGPDEAASLRRELADMREARAMDLAEMKALLAELEPILESVDA